jgi:hypothetical protein
MSLYNIIVLGDGVPGARQRLRQNIEASLDSIGVDRGHVRFWSRDEVAQVPRRSPTVAVFIAPAQAPEDLMAASQLAARGVVLIPVVADLTRFTAERPDILAGYNGLEIGADGAGMPRLVSAVLEWLGLMRRQRRLFLSYRRDQAREAALRLFEVFQAAGFDVFLDTHDIRPGEDFQGVLMHRLSDCEIVVLLDTPGFIERRWTQEELARANLLGIGVLQVVWPGHSPPRRSPISVQYALDLAELLGPTGPLSDAAMSGLILMAETLRASVIAHRTAALSGEFTTRATRLGARVVALPDRSLRAEWPDGRVVIALPTLGVPAADRYHDAFEAAAEAGAEPPVLVYDDTGVLDRWVRHLDWLDVHLPIRTMKVNEITRRLRAP